MKKILFAVMMVVLSADLFNEKDNVGKNTVYDIKEIVSMERDRRWESMVSAICQRESGMDDRARNPRSSAVGRFQMLRGYVDDVNRICGEKRYTYDDRYNPVKAREMFDIVQGHYNPEKDIDKAIIMHRGKKDWKYFNDVKRLMEERK